MDPFLAQGFSNLTKALIGDPNTDYQVAQTNRINTLTPFEKEKLEAIAKNNLAEAGKFNAQTFDLEQAAKDLMTLSNNSDLANAFVAPLGLPLDKDGNQTVIPLEAASALARTILQGGNPQQNANAINTVGGARAQRAGERAILTGTDNEAGRGALLLNPTGGQYQNPGFANEQLQAQINIADMESKDDLAADKFATTQQYGKGGSADRVAKIEAEAEKEWQEAVQELRNKSALEIAKIGDETARYDIDQSNKRLKDESLYKQYITVNGEMIVSPELGQKLGIQPDPTNNKYTMGFGNTEDMIEVEIENPGGTPTTVKVAPENIEKLNPVTRNGKLVIPDGHNFNAATPKENRENLTKFNTDFEKDIKNYTVLGELPGSALVKVREYAYNNLNLDIADGKPYDQAYAESVLPILQSGNITVATGRFGGGKFLFPEYFYNATRNNPAKLKTTAIEMGYSNEQAEALVNYQN
jgi:hypothetical protein